MNEPRRAMHRVWPWYAAFAVLVALDQFIKHLVRTNFALHESIPILGDDLVRLTHVENPGIAFGLTFIGPKFLLFFGWAAAILLAVYLFMLVREQSPMRWPVMLFLAGATGNSIDRTLFGKVTDFVDVDFPDIFIERWPVFNLADSCVTIGIVLVLLLSIRTHRHHSSQSESKNDQLPDSSNTLYHHDGTRSAAAAD